MRLGKNQFDAIVRAIAAMFDIEFKGTIYSMRYSIVTGLFVHKLHINVYDLHKRL